MSYTKRTVIIRVPNMSTSVTKFRLLVIQDSLPAAIELLPLNPNFFREIIIQIYLYTYYSLIGTTKIRSRLINTKK